MKAAIFKTLGAAKDVLEIMTLEDPSPGHGEVLVRLRSSAINPSDVKKRAGAFPDLLDDGFVIPHSDGAGVIEAVGQGIPSSRVGERVWVYQAQYERRFGTAAEFVSLPSSRAVVLPEAVPFDVGACMGIPAMTAHRCVLSDGPVEGKTLLIMGGAGRVGHYAIQLAKYAGAKVVATASNDLAREHCLEAGADAVCSHAGDELSELVAEMTQGRGVERVVDGEFGANLPVLLDVMDTGATIATYSSVQVPEPTLPFKRMLFMDLNLRLVLVYAMPEEAKRHAINDLSEHLEHNRLQHRVAHRLPLEQVVRGHELIEQGDFYGAVVLNMPS